MILYPKLEVLKNEIALEWSRGRPFILQAGQRSGKTIMINKLVGEVMACESPSPKVFWVDTTILSARIHSEFITARGIKVLHKSSKQLLNSFDAVVRNRKPDPVQQHDVVVIDEAFWDSLGETLFWRVARNTCRVIAIGSAGDDPWMCDPIIHKYATWDLNPYISREDLSQEFRDDPKRATRDFGIPERRVR